MAKKFWDKLTHTEKDALNQIADGVGWLTGRERSADCEQNLIAGPALRELRESQQISQEELAGRLDRSQSAISQIEKRGDLLLSTFTQYVEAIGGKFVHFTVRFPEGDVRVAPFKAKQHDSESKAQPDS